MRVAGFYPVVDVQCESTTPDQWYSTTLDEEDIRMMYPPIGFAHGSVVLTEIADFCTGYYHTRSGQEILWNDSSIGFEFPITDAQLPEKGKNNPVLLGRVEQFLPQHPVS